MGWYDSSSCLAATRAALQKCPYGRAGGTWGHKHPFPQPPRSIAAKPSSGWIYRQGSSHLQSFFASLAHSQSQEPPVHGGLKDIQHSSHSLAPTDRQHPGNTGATSTLHRHGQGGFHPQQTPNPSFPNQEHRAGADEVCGAGG